MTRWRKGWAILGDDVDWRRDWNEAPYWAFDVFKQRAEALRCRGAGERVVRIEYRFPKARKRK